MIKTSYFIFSMNFSMIYSATKRVIKNTLRVYYLKPIFYRLNLVKSQKAYNHHFYEKWLIKFLFFREVILVQSWINRHRSLCKSLKSSTTKFSTSVVFCSNDFLQDCKTCKFALARRRVVQICVSTLG